MAAIPARTSKGAMITHLISAKGTHQQITPAHIAQIALDIERAADKRASQHVLQVGSMLRPCRKHFSAVFFFDLIPLSRIAPKSIGQFFPHKSCVFARRSLRGVEKARGTAPCNGRWHAPSFMVVDHRVKISGAFKAHDCHKSLI